MIRHCLRRGAKPTCCLAIVIAAVTVFLSGFVESTPVIDIYRLIQSDLDGMTVGSSITNFRTLATLPNHEKLARAVVVVPPSQVKPEVCAAVLQKKAGIEGLLLVLPHNYDKEKMSPDAQEDWKAVQHLLLTTPLDIPVFFAVQNDAIDDMVLNLQKMIDAGKPPSTTSAGYTLVAKKTQKGLPQKLPPAKGVNFAGFLNGAQGATSTIAIVASYDTFLAAPGLAGGADSNGSGAVVLMQLLRTFSHLYHGVASRGKYNLLFLLASGGPYNFEGTAQYLNQMDAPSLEAVEFVLCLDSLGGSAPLHLHYSKPPKDTVTAAWYQALASAAERQGVELQQVHKKINISSTAAAWEHEQFSRRRILAATLAARAEPAPYLERSGLHDQLPNVDTDKLRAAAHLVGDALAHIVYPDVDPGMDLVAAGAAATSGEVFTSVWLRALSTTPRMLPFLAANSTLLRGIERVFADAADKAVVQTWNIEANKYKFYGEIVAQLQIYRSPSILFHVNLLLFNILYLGGLFVVLRVATRGWDDLMAIFRPSPTKRKRS